MNTRTFLKSDAETHGDMRSTQGKAARARRGNHLRPAVPDTGTVPLKRIHVWDLPLRVFHWSLVAAVTVAIITGEIGGSLMEIEDGPLVRFRCQVGHSFTPNVLNETQNEALEQALNGNELFEEKEKEGI